jgi:hypothetical protein
VWHPRSGSRTRKAILRCDDDSHVRPVDGLSSTRKPATTLGSRPLSGPAIPPTAHAPTTRTKLEDVGVQRVRVAGSPPLVQPGDLSEAPHAVEHARTPTVGEGAWPVTRRHGKRRHRREPGHRPGGGCAALVEGEIPRCSARPPALCSYVPQGSSAPPAAHERLRGTPSSCRRAGGVPEAFCDHHQIRPAWTATRGRADRVLLGHPGR